MRLALPENRNALYDPRDIIGTVMDADSVLELRRDFGIGVTTAFARPRGQPVAVAASQPRHLGGALDAPACDKLARFMQLADAYGLPLITFVHSSGFMVGPESETTATAAWPSGEFGPMGIEGSVRLGFRKELEAAAPETQDWLLRGLQSVAGRPLPPRRALIDAW